MFQMYSQDELWAVDHKIWISDLLKIHKSVRVCFHFASLIRNFGTFESAKKVPNNPLWPPPLWFQNLVILLYLWAFQVLFVSTAFWCAQTSVSKIQARWHIGMVMEVMGLNLCSCYQYSLIGFTREKGIVPFWMKIWYKVEFKAAHRGLQKSVRTWKIV